MTALILDVEQPDAFAADSAGMRLPPEGGSFWPDDVWGRARGVKYDGLFEQSGRLGTRGRFILGVYNLYEPVAAEPVAAERHVVRHGTEYGTPVMKTALHFGTAVTCSTKEMVQSCLVCRHVISLVAPLFAWPAAACCSVQLLRVGHVALPALPRREVTCGTKEMINPT